MKMIVTQVTFMSGQALVGGEPEGDRTKVIIAAAEPAEAFTLAMAVAAGMQPVVEPPDDAIVDILERPQE